MACVYQHIRLDKNEVFYIGIGKSHKRAYSQKSRNKHWVNIINLLNGNFTVEILFDNISWKEATLKEIELISNIGRKDLKLGNLVNLTNGGEGTLGIERPTGANHWSFGKSNISVIGDKNPMRRQDVIEKFKGSNNPSFGKTPSDKAGLAKIPVTMTNLENDIVTDFISIRDATRFLKMNGFPKADFSSIAKCIKGKRKTCYNATWSLKIINN